jgi:hypothetical protein
MRRASRTFLRGPQKPRASGRWGLLARPFVEANQAQAFPAASQQKRRRSDGDPRFTGWWQRDLGERPEAVELRGRRAGVEPPGRQTQAGLRPVPLIVSEHVNEHPAHLKRRAQCARVIAVVEKPALAARAGVHSASQTDREPLHASSERAPVCGFHDEMQVIALHRIMDQAHAEAFTCAGERAPHCAKDLAAPQTSHTAHDPQRDVKRMFSRE